jgi:membrane-bound metal-dependent hydrolase YbcI (DUF457 family)
MRAGTHGLVGIGIAALAAQAVDLDPMATAGLVGAALVGSRLPDVDVAGARVHRRTVLERRSALLRAVGSVARLPLRLATGLRHRGITHSVLACALVPLLAGVLASVAGASAGRLAGAGVAIGYVAHVAADACTPAGVRAWAPFKRSRVWLLPRGRRIRTGGAMELAFALLFALVAAGGVAVLA